MTSTIDPTYFPKLREDDFLGTLNFHQKGTTTDLNGGWMTGMDYPGEDGYAVPFSQKPHLFNPPFVYNDADGLVMEMRENAAGTKWVGLHLQTVNANKEGFTQNSGYWEWDAKLPSGKGLWIGFWGLHADRDANDNVEIDAIEWFPERHSRGKSLDHALILQDGPPSGPAPNWTRNKTDILDPADAEANWHTYSFYWDPAEGVAIWYLDRQEVHRETSRIDLLDRPFYPMISFKIEIPNVNFTQDELDDLDANQPHIMRIRRFTAWGLPTKKSLAADIVQPLVKPLVKEIV